MIIEIFSELYNEECAELLKLLDGFPVKMNFSHESEHTCILVTTNLFG